MSIQTTISLVIWAIIALFILFHLVRSVQIVPQRKAYLVERLGRYRMTLKSGFHVLIPFVDRIADRLDLKEETIDVPPQECFTKDEVRVIVDGVLYVSVVDAAQAAYGITDYKNGAMQLAQTTTRSVIGQLTLDRTFEEREFMSSKVVEVLAETGKEWGIHVHRYEIKNIQPPPTVHESMEKQVTAERERRAIIARSLGDKESRINRSEGIKNELINRSEGAKQQRINEAQGKAAELLALAKASAESISMIAAAIQTPGGSEAVKLQLSEQYIAEMNKLARPNAQLTVPMDVVSLDTMLDRLGIESSTPSDRRPASASANSLPHRSSGAPRLSSPNPYPEP